MQGIQGRTALAAAITGMLLVACGGVETGATATDALDVAACTDRIAALRSETLAAQFKLSRDQAGLLVKLDEAAQKLALGKPVDAVQKLTDYELKVQALIAQGKIRASLDGAVTPQLLVDGSQAAIDCIAPPPPPDPATVVSGA